MIKRNLECAKLSKGARKLVEDAEAFVEKHFGLLCPESYEAKLNLIGTDEKLAEEQIGEWMDHFVELTTIFPQLPREQTALLVEVQVLKTAVSFGMIFAIAPSADKSLRGVEKTYVELVQNLRIDRRLLSREQREILDALVLFSQEM